MNLLRIKAWTRGPMSYVLCPADHYMIESYKFWRCDALTSCGSELIIEDFNA